MDYLNYGNKVEKKPSQKFTALQNSARKQPQEFLTVKPKISTGANVKTVYDNIDLNQKVDMSIDDFKFGDLNKQKVVPMGSEPMTLGLLDQCSTI